MDGVAVGVELAHGDYRLDNRILSSDGGVAAVIDWALAALGDPRGPWPTAGLLEPHHHGCSGGHHRRRRIRAFPRGTS
ncbi:phosphotransferase [Mycolicibacterium sp.]|uniref:phosphotransferase n=1 Tax=Mycolicibacterium sp. TaxID=2320850 RepID=UPI003D1434E1